MPPERKKEGITSNAKAVPFIIPLFLCWGINLEEGSNASIFYASIMPPFLKTLITQNLKLKSQNNTVGYDLHYFIYASVKNYDIPTLFWLSSRTCEKCTNVDNLETLILQLIYSHINKIEMWSFFMSI